MESLAHDLLLLMTNLAQMEDSDRAVTLFTEALSSLSPGFSVRYSADLPDEGTFLDVSTASGNYGYLIPLGDPRDVGPSFSALLDNSVQILATILEGHQNRVRVLGERRRLQEEVEAKTASLRRSDERYRSMIANISDVIGVVSPDGIITYKSPNIERWFGWKPEELEGTDAWATVHPEDLEWIQATFTEVLETEADPRTVVYRYRCRDGSYRWIELTAVNRVHDPAIGGVLLNYHDVTERRRAEEALKNREEQFRLAIEGSRDGLWDWDLKTGEAFYSDRFATMLGYEPGELPYSGEAWTTLLHPDDVVGARKAVEEYLAGASPTYESIFRMRAKDGSYRWVIGRGKALFEDDGTPVRFVGFNTDITELKETEENLRTDERRWTLAQAVSRFGNWEFDVSTGEIWGSREAFELFGVPLDLEDNPRQILPLKRVEASITDGHLVHQALVDLVAHNQPYELEYTVTREDTGEEIIIHSRAERIDGPDGTLEKVIGTIQDVTERKRSEERLKASEERYRSLFNNINEAFALHEIITDDQGRPVDFVFLDVNPMYEKLTGLKAEEIVGKRGREVLPRLEQKWIDTYGKVALTGEPVSLIDHSEYLDRYWEVRAYSPNPGQFAVAFVDFTPQIRAEEERARLEEQLHQAQKLETVGRLAGGVAHDFNNMLGAILGNAELFRTQLERDGKQPPPELDEIEKAASRSTELTRQLLGFARRQTVTPRVLDLNDTISGMYRMLLRIIGEHIDLIWAPKRNLWPVKIDPSQVDQILTNLLVNSRDAIQGTGKVILETDNVTIEEPVPGELDAPEAGDYAMFSVIDEGVGMNQEVLANLFEPFFTTKDQGQGTGLGLATVYGIVKQNGGFIEVISAPGEGATFKVYLPRFVGPLPEEEGKGEAEPIQGGSETVLVVEDADAVLRMATRTLEDLGYEVLGALRPGDALEMAAEYDGPIHLLLTDVRMPEMNGRELAAELRKLLGGIEVLHMSGYSADIIGRDGVLGEGTHFIQKPFNRKTLAKQIRAVLD